MAMSISCRPTQTPYPSKWAIKKNPGGHDHGARGLLHTGVIGCNACETGLFSLSFLAFGF